MHVEIDRIDEADDARRDRGALQRVLRDVREAVEDWEKMHSQVLTIVDELDDRPAAAARRRRSPQGKALLQLARRRPLHLPRLPRVPPRATRATTSSLRAVPGTGLGILRPTRTCPPSFGKLPAAVRAKAREKTLLVLAKANSRATVHRPAYLDYVGVKTFDADGEVVGERRFLGLFSCAAYTESRHPDPGAAREGRRGASRRAGFDAAQPRRQGADGHPGELSARRAVPDPGRRAGPDRRGRDAHPRAPPAAAVRPPRHLRPLLSCLVYLPRDRYNTAVRERIAADPARRSLGGEPSSSPPGSASRSLARLHFVVRPPKGETIRARSTSPSSSAGSPRRPAPGATTSWPRCAREYGEEAGARLARRVRRRRSPRPTRRTSRRAPARSTSAGWRRSRATRASTCRSTSRSTPAAARRGSRSSGSASRCR